LCGYAGGLSPDNVESQIKLIRKVASHFWIDAETGLRTNGEFDLTKVEQFIDLAYACAYPNKE
jgi:phosphoribosylanthranilate isomerase